MVRALVTGNYNAGKVIMALTALANPALRISEVLITSPKNRNAIDALAKVTARTFGLRVTTLQNNLHNPDALFAEIKAGGRIDGIYTPSDAYTGLTNQFGVRLAAADLMPLRDTLWDQRTLDAYKNKFDFRQIVNQKARHLDAAGTNNLLYEAWCKAVAPNDLNLAHLRSLGAPDHVVFMPQVGRASLGVQDFYLDAPNADRLVAEYVSGAQNLSQHDMAVSTGFDRIIISEHAGPSEEYNVDGWIAGGKTFIAGIHWKTDIDRKRNEEFNPNDPFLQQGSQFIEGSKVTIPFSSSVAAHLIEGASTLFDGNKSGVFHLEVRHRLIDGKIYLIEPNPLRPCGALLPLSLRQSTGHDITVAQACLALGIPYPYKNNPKVFEAAGELTVFARRPGTFKGYTITEPNGSKAEISNLDEQTAIDVFNNLLRTVDRSTIRENYLKPYLLDGNHSSEFREKVIREFDSTLGTGLSVQVTNYHPWLENGKKITSIDAEYAMDLVTALTDNFPINRRDSFAAVAEIVAAHAILQSCIRCETE